MAQAGVLLLRLQNVKKVFNSFVAVDNVTLEVAEGEFVCFLGPSGCGKTTTLRMIAGLEMPTEGEIFLREKRITYLPPQQRAIGFVFQNYALFWHMTVYENLVFGLRLRRFPAAEINKRVHEIAERFELMDLLKVRAALLDLSAMQRVAIARTLLIDPHLLLLDEPLNNIRPGLREMMRADLKRMQQELGKTMIYVTHDQEEALTLGDRIVVMSKGKIEQVGSPQEVYDVPATLFVAGFIGRPPMNLFDVQYEVENGHSWLVWRQHRWCVDKVRNQIEAAQPEKGLVLGVRPEKLKISYEASGIPAKVLLVQPLGRKDVLTLDLEGTTVHGVIPSELRINVGDVVFVEFPPEGMHVFSTATKGAIVHGIS
jgi:multiple sugar transport system ATP-binding protein